MLRQRPEKQALIRLTHPECRDGWISQPGVKPLRGLGPGRLCSRKTSGLRPGYLESYDKDQHFSPYFSNPAHMPVYLEF